MPDEATSHRPRRRPVLLAMLAAAALLLALAGSGAFAGGGDPSSGGSSSGGSGVVQGSPAAEQDRSGDGKRHDGRDCPRHRDRQNSSDPANPPV